MGMRGLHLALSDEELRTLRALAPEARPDHIANVLEATKFGSDDACETDKSWAYMNAAFTGTDPDGSLGLPPSRQASAKPGLLGALFGKKVAVTPLAKADERNAILGRDVLLCSDDYYIGLVPADEVPDVSAALAVISNEDLGRRVRQVHAGFNASGSADEAADYAMSWYPDLAQFFARSASVGRHVIFTVDF